MKVTRRFWTLTTAGIVLAALAVLFSRPILLAGAVGIGGVLLARQYLFVRAVARTDDALTVTLSVPRAYVDRDDETPVTLTATLDDPSPLAVTVEADLPVIATDRTTTVGEAEDTPPTHRRLELDPGDQSAQTTRTLAWPVVGTAHFEPPTVRATDPFGLFVSKFQRGDAPTVTVEPRNPQHLHVGQGGEATAAAFGGHQSGQYGQGIDPVELREYTTGDSVSDIDWKATARLAYPHVREYEVETDYRTVLLVDHRGSLGAGREGETKLDYLREVALTIAAAAADADDPLGLYAVGDDGITAEHAPSTTAETYRTVRTALHDLAPTRATTGATGTVGAGARQSPADARRVAARLADDDTGFGTTLRPYMQNTDGYVRRIGEDPLFKTARTHLRGVGDGAFLMLFSDDTDRQQLRETVKVARQHAGSVVVFLAPDVLFERGGLSDLDRAYDAYVDFEEFRRDLTRLDGVTAFEVGPGERLDALLSSQRQQRRQS